MKKLKYFIIILIIVLIIAIAILVYINRENENNPIANVIQQVQEEEEVENEITPEEIKNEVSKSLKKQIQYKDVNSFYTTTISDEGMAKKYYSDFTYKMLYKPEAAYEQLDKEYREKRFKNYNNFLSYVNDIAGVVAGETYGRYLIEEGDGYTLYTTAGQNTSDTRRYYFKETSVMKYTAYLDNYTLVSEQEEKQYDLQNEGEKVKYNLAKFLSMVEQKDYLQSYNLLDEDFRKDNFPTINDFKDYIKSQYFSDNYFNSCEKIGEENGFLKYQLVLSDNASEDFIDKDTITKTFYIKLGEDMNFRLKFDI